MKQREWVRASEPLCEILSGWERMPMGFYTLPSPWIAACIRAESSAFSPTQIYIEAFPLPLFVPAEALYFDYGFRVGGSWDGVTAELLADIPEAVQRLLASCRLESLEASASQPDLNIRHTELRFVASLLRGDRQAASTFRQLLEAWQVRVPWEAEVRERCLTLGDHLDEPGQRELEERRERLLRSLLKARASRQVET